MSSKATLTARLTQVLVDTREPQQDTFVSIIQRRLDDKKCSVQVVKKALEHGDVQFIYDITLTADQQPSISRSGLPMLVVERKTLADLASSIVDERYRKQKAQMLSTFRRDVLMYIIEGSITDAIEDREWQHPYRGKRKGAGVSMSVLFGATANLIFRDRITQYHTETFVETAEFLAAMAVKYSTSLPLTEAEVSRVIEELACSSNIRIDTDNDNDTKTEDSSRDEQKAASDAYETHLALHAKDKFSKKKTMETTPLLGLKAMLCTVYGISPKTATTITDRYSSMSELVDAFRDAKKTCGGDMKRVYSSMFGAGQPSAAKTKAGRTLPYPTFEALAKILC